jgi:hypothetical protein
MKTTHASYTKVEFMNVKKLSLRRFFGLLFTSSILLVAGFGWAAPAEDILDTTHANVRAVMALQGQMTSDLMKLEGILGTAVGLDDSDQPAMVVYVDRDGSMVSEIVRAFPPQIRGIGIKLELTDKFRAMGGRPGGASHTVKQTPPIQLGTSGGWSYDLANGYCCGGTLGSLIQVKIADVDTPIQYILSNYHVFESDIVSGGNNRVAQLGNPIIQPGLIDLGCSVANAQNVGILVPVYSLPASNVDCSVAQVVSSMVRTDGAILEIGTISSQTVAASVKKPVKKSGRTTGLTRSSISGLNATISVAYDNECAGGAAFTKTFTGQILIANKGNSFLNGGDSGSLMVEDVSSNPKAVGLLYAGSSTIAVANPIGEVLRFLGSKLGGTATMVGQ